MDTTDQIYAMLQKKVWAVVGASDNETKFGHKIFKLLEKAGYQVYPVNPGLEKVLGKKSAQQKKTEQGQRCPAGKAAGQQAKDTAGPGRNMPGKAGKVCAARSAGWRGKGVGHGKLRERRLLRS